jgi:hypothetical protein
MTVTEFQWSADLVLHRGPVDDPVLLFAENTAKVEGDFNEVLLQTHCVDWVAEQVHAEPGQLNVVFFAWSDIPKPAEDFPPPPSA